jgi:GTP-binding protein
VVRAELEQYGAGLADKPEVIALTKADLLDGKQRAKLVKALEKETGATVFPISAPLEEGMEPLLDAMIERLAVDEGIVSERGLSPAQEKPWSPL